MNSGGLKMEVVQQDAGPTCWPFLLGIVIHLVMYSHLSASAIFTVDWSFESVGQDKKLQKSSTILPDIWGGANPFASPHQNYYDRRLWLNILGSLSWGSLIQRNKSCSPQDRTKPLYWPCADATQSLSVLAHKYNQEILENREELIK